VKPQTTILGNRVVLLLTSLTILACVPLLARAQRKTVRDADGLRGHVTDFALAKYLPYDGLGTVDLLDDSTLAIELGGLQWVDDEPLRVPPNEFFAFTLNDSGVSLVQHEGKTFIDVNGEALIERGLAPERVVRTTLPPRAAVDLAGKRYAVYSETGRLHIDLREDGMVSYSVEDEQTGEPLFSFRALLVTNQTDATQIASGGPVAQPVYPKPGSNCHATCPGGRSCDINCGTEGCAAWCRGKKPKCMCLAQ